MSDELHFYFFVIFSCRLSLEDFGDNAEMATLALGSKRGHKGSTPIYLSFKFMKEPSGSAMCGHEIIWPPLPTRLIFLLSSNNQQTWNSFGFITYQLKTTANLY